MQDPIIRPRAVRAAALGLLFLFASVGLAFSGNYTAPVAADGGSGQSPFTAMLQVTPSHATPGTVVQVSGSGYPAETAIALVFYTAVGRYELEGGTEFVGQRYDRAARILMTLQSDAAGTISGQLETPLDYGGPHDIRGRVAGREISQANLTIDPTFALTPAEGPVGTMVELRMTGVDYHTNINTWEVLYDNRLLGFMSAVTTRGTAVARLRAAGPVGDHPISVWHNSFNPIPYLNFQQGPYKDVPTHEFTFRVTSDAGLSSAAVEDFSAIDNPLPEDTNGPGSLSLSVDRGPVGLPTTLRGNGLPRNTEVTVRWWTMVGNRVSAIGFSPEVRTMGTVTTQSDGAFSFDLALPDDLGGYHRIDVAQGDTSLGSVGVVIQPSVVSVTAEPMHAGEQIKIHLKGVGWTTYDNTYGVTYDNSYIGYVCGFSTNGDVQFSVTATGAPGTHLIDLYPTIYKGKDDQPRVYSVPQLTYAQDHPRRITPAIRVSVQIVP